MINKKSRRFDIVMNHWCSCSKVVVVILMLAFVAFSGNTYGYKQFGSFAGTEDSLVFLSKGILSEENDSIKYSLNNSFIKLLKKTLQDENSVDYSFDSLKTIAILLAPDKSFRIFNWHINKEDGTFEYFGFIQMLNSNKAKVYKLSDASSSISNPSKANLSPENWFGAHYYKIIYSKHKKNEMYTLLGWDGNTNYSTRKIIDVLHFGDDGAPVFGMPIFGDNNDLNSRVLFEFSADATMSLRYEKQHYYVIKRKKDKSEKKKKKGKHINDFNKQFKNQKRKPKKTKEKTFFKRKESQMIVFDKLIPLNSNLEGVYSYYVPAVNIFDAYIFVKGKWLLEPDVDARNPEPEKKKKTEKKEEIIEK